MSLGTIPDSGLFAKLMSGAWTTHPALVKTGMSVLKRDNFRCEGCGFVTRPSRQVNHGWMIPVCMKHAGGLPIDKDSSKTYCPFCASSRAINWATVNQKQAGRDLPAPGLLVSFPFMTQEELNRLAMYVICRLSVMPIGNRTAEDAVAMSINDAMKARQNNLEIELEPYSVGRDSHFAKALSMLPPEFYQKRDDVIGMLRWWPNLEYWEEQGVYWGKATFKL